MGVYSAVLLAIGHEATAAVLVGQFTERNPGDTVDLTSAGTTDWVHWGSSGTNATRRAGITPVIGSLAMPAGATQVTNGVAFSWNNGTPVATATNVGASIATPGSTNAFTLKVPADTSLYKLKIFAGAYAARGRLTVSLDGVASYVNFSLDSTDAVNGVYVVDFIANKIKDDLTVSYHAAALHQSNGFVTLQAIALARNTAPQVHVTAPSPGVNLVTGTVIALEANAVDDDGSIARVEFLLGGSKIGEVTNAPYALLWTPTNTGPQTLVARATDSNGAQATSTPVMFYVNSTNGFLTAEVAEAPPFVNLTSEGTSDWVHWGYLNENSIDRKAGVTAQISDLSLMGFEPKYQYADNQTAFTWTDGSPHLVVNDSPTGVYVAGLGNGFQLTVPADQNARTLRIYLGTYGARGRFTAQLSDHSGPFYADSSVENTGNGPASVYSISYAAGTAGQTLQVTFTSDLLHDSQYGNVTFQAATLQSASSPLSIAIASPLNNAIFTAPANIPVEAFLAGGDGANRRVEFFQGTTKIGQAAAPPYSMEWLNVASGNYTLTARTTNQGGIMLTSAPVQVFVTATGGTLQGKFEVSSGSVDLTTEGSDDWVHWGLVRKNSVNRKRNVTQRISDFTEIGRGFLDQYGDNLVGFQWSDGTPTETVAGTTTGLFKYELRNGFQITVPADQVLRRLKVYVGVFAAQGEIEVSLGDASAAPYINSSLQSVYNNATAVYTIDFSAASAGQSLRVRYISKTLFDPTWGNVTLQAAALGYVPPTLTITPIPGGAIGLAFRTHPGWNYLVDHAESLYVPEWAVLTNQPGTGDVVNLFDSSNGMSNRFYRVRMVPSP